jgi:hypothetical protein
MDLVQVGDRLYQPTGMMSSGRSSSSIWTTW